MSRDVLNYVQEGQRWPSVTEILDLANMGPDWSVVDPEVLAEAAQRGTDVHDWIEKTVAMPEMRDVPPPPHIEGYVAAFEDFRGSVELEILACEQVVFNAAYRYAGTFDLLAYVNKELALIDFKARAGLSPDIGPQLAGYHMALPKELTNGKRPKRYALLLRADGSFRYVEHKDRSDFNVFASAAVVVNWALAAGRLTLPARKG